MDIDSAKEFARDWIDAWNSHDIERVIGHYAEEIEFKSPIIFERCPDAGGVIRSREKLREYFLIGLTKNPALHFELLEVLPSVDAVIVHYKNARGGRTAELSEFGPTNEVISSTSCYSS